MLSPGSIAPSFNLPNDSGKMVSLATFKGSWLLIYFYPKDDTPGCTKEACAFRDHFPLYENIGIAVVGISKDTPESHRKFKEKYNLPFELLSDTDGRVSLAYGSGVGENPKRVSYLISPDGTIAQSYKTVDPATHATEVLEDLKKLKS